MTLRWPVSIDGTGYAVDVEQLRVASIERIRQQGDDASEFGESSLHPADLWRRSQDDWSFGAGREYVDKRDDDTEGSRRRFFSSSRVQPWTRGELTLTNAAVYFGDLVDALGLVVAEGKICYVTNDGADWKVYTLTGAEVTGDALYPGTDVYPATDLYPEEASGAFNLLLTQVSEQAIDVATDGHFVYVLHENGVDQVDLTAGTNTQVVPQSGDWVGFTKGRLLIGDAGTLYDASSGTAVDVTPSTINSNWQWVSATESGQAIYVAGVGSERSTVFSISVTQDGASLDAPVPAATLPYGELVNVVYGYGESVVIGTTLGFRIASVSQGNLYFGPLIDVGPVTSLSAFGTFVYYGGNDANDLGFVGRIDLSRATSTLVPAYAQDLFTADSDRTLQGAETETIRDIVVLDNTLMWLVENHLWYETTAQYAIDGTLTSGSITYDLSELKVYERIEVSCDPLNAEESIDVAVIIDEVEYAVTTISGVGAVGGDYDISVSGNTARYKLTLHRSTDDPTVTPVVKRVTLRALPRTSTGDQVIVPVILRERVRDLLGQVNNFDTMAEYNALKTLERTGDLIDLDFWGTTTEAVIDGVQFGPELEYTSDRQGLQGVCTVVLRTFYPLEN